MSDDGILIRLAASFAGISLMAVGGANAVLPEIQRLVVDQYGWVSATELAELFALGQAAPGPNVLVVSLIGWRMAGVAGALAATLGMCGPTCVLTYLLAGWWERFRAARWRRIVQAGLAPVTVGLVLASGFVLSQAAAYGPLSWVISAVTAVAVMATRLNPLVLLAVAGVLGALGAV